MTRLRNNQQGHSTVKVIAVVIVVVIIGVAGWMIYKDQHKTTTAPTTIETINSTTDSLVIPEWGIKVKLGNADARLLRYDLDGPSAGPTGPLASSAVLSLKSSVTAISDCQILGVVIEQGQVSGYSGGGEPSHVVGNYYYSASGIPASCGVSKLDAIRVKYSDNNSSKWVYSPTD